MKTLVVLGTREVNNRRLAHGDELPPNLLPPEVVDWWLDHKWLVEYESSEHRSLYRIFAPFSGAKEREHLTTDELRELALSK